MGNSINILLCKSLERCLDLQRKFIISINFTVVRFDKLHIGAAILDFSLPQLLLNQTAQFLPKLIFYMYLQNNSQ